MEESQDTPDSLPVPVILLSGNNAGEIDGQALKFGGLTNVIKPSANWQITDLVNLTLQTVGKT